MRAVADLAPHRQKVRVGVLLALEGADVPLAFAITL
jgi:hypothetical protein